MKKLVLISFLLISLTLILYANFFSHSLDKSENPTSTITSTDNISKSMTITRLDGSSISTSDIDKTVSRLMQAAKVTGVGITIFNQGNITYQKTYGFRDKDQSLPLSPHSVMTAASFTKVAFAYMVMQLVDESILDLDKPIYLYLPKPLPEYDKYKDLSNDPRYKKITSRMLLNHTSGFPNWRWLTDDNKLAIYFEPGSRFAYSGEGISLLQLVVETITNTPLQDLMHQRIFKPFAMNRSSMIWQTPFESDFANAYDQNQISLGPQRRKNADAAGSMQTTLHDFSLFIQTVIQGKALSKNARELMFSPQIEIVSKHQFPTLAKETTQENRSIRLSYGLGWGLYWTPYGKAFFKEGHDDGLCHYTVCFDDKKLGIIIMTNSANGESIYKELLETLINNTFTPIEWERFTPYNQLP
jgi:CubicO group peptidase (beta-lactamase class C family)